MRPGADTTHGWRPTSPGSSDSVVVIIGASSGIGLSTAREFARRGCHLVLASRSTQRLEVVAGQCRAAGAASALVVETDVSDEASVDTLFERALAAHATVDVVVTTATVMAYGRVEDVPAQVFSTVVDTAIQGTFFVARATLRVFRAHHRGTLVIVSSLLAEIAAPEMSAYVTAKWGQAGLIRTLQIETRNERDIKICAVSPGGVNTPIYSQAANVTGRAPRPPIPVDPPEKVARAVVGCVDRPKMRVSVGLANPVIVFGFRFLPKVYDALVTPLLHVASLSRPGSTTAGTGNVLAPMAGGESEHGPWSSKWNPRQL